MIRIYALILTSLLFSHSFAEEKYYIQENTIHYTDEVLCALAISIVPAKELITCGVYENRYSIPLTRPTIVSEVSPENLLPIPLPRPVFINKEINPVPVPLPVFVDPNSWLTRV